MRTCHALLGVYAVLAFVTGCPSNTNVGDADDSAVEASVDATADNAVVTDAADARDAIVTDAPPADAPIDAPSDTRPDAPAIDAALDVPLDVPVDAPVDAPVDVPRDAVPMDGGSTRFTITSFSAYANCMPIVPPDPVNASWTLSVSGSTGTTATVVMATLTKDPQKRPTSAVVAERFALAAKQPMVAGAAAPQPAPPLVDAATLVQPTGASLTAMIQPTPPPSRAPRPAPP